MLRSASTGRIAALALLCVIGCAGIYVAASSGGAAAGVFAAIAVACGVLLVARTEREANAQLELATVFDSLLLALPGALIVFFAFNSGGYFPDMPAVVAVVLVIVLVLRVTLLEHPFVAFSTPLAVAAAALGLFTLWILLSAAWSDSTGRAVVGYDRAFMYLLVLVIAGSVLRTASRLRWMAVGIAVGVVVVAVASLATRLAPDHFPTSIQAIGESNLAYPVTYSNALGMLCVFGAIPCFYFATSVRQKLAARALGAAALPILATTVYLTLSRGPVAAAIIAFTAYLLIGRPRGLISGLVATVPTSVLAVAVAYHHPVLSSQHPQTAAAAVQGHRVAEVLVLCVVAAAGLRIILAPLDRRLQAFSLPPERRRSVAIGGWVALLVVVLVVAAAIDAPSKASDQYHRFVNSGEASPTQDVRQSVFSSANRGIVDNWSVAMDAFRDSPLHGQGAGAYEVYWNQHRPARQAVYDVTNAHSLYVEVLGELGIVGFALLVTLLLAFLVALLPVGRGANRQLYAALFAMELAWVVHAGVDWDWQMPAVTVGAIALGGAALATHQSKARAIRAPQSARVITALLLLASAVLPALVLLSQRDLNDAREALRANRCGESIRKASDSIKTLEIRPEPYELIALCQAHRGYTGFAIQAMRKASQRDPDNWRYHFELGVLLGAASHNTRPELLRARQLNPHYAATKQLLEAAPAGEAVNWDLELLGPQGSAIGQR